MEQTTQLPLPPNVIPAMLRPNFWLERTAAADTPLCPSERIAAFNTRAYTRIDIPPVLDLPDELPAARIRAELRAFLPTRTRYTAEGHALEPAAFESVLANAIPPLPDQVLVQFGLVVQRTDVRAFPTAGVITARPFEYAFDRIQETTIDIGWPVAICTASQDKRWYFALTPHYWGWFRAEHIALAPRDEVQTFVQAEHFLLTTASRGLVSLGAEGGVTPQMGTRLPLHTEHEPAQEVVVPRRAPDGTATYARGHVSPASLDFHTGYLPLTQRSLLVQAFKLLHEPYAWGGTRMGIFGRDCSRLVRDVYATTGVLLPRNGDQQRLAGVEQVAFTRDMTAAERQAALVEQATPGAILEMPGHVMLYLGHVDGVPYIIHDTSSNGYNGVIVSDLSLGESGPDGSLLSRLSYAVTVG